MFKVESRTDASVTFADLNPGEFRVYMSSTGGDVFAAKDDTNAVVYFGGLSTLQVQDIVGALVQDSAEIDWVYTSGVSHIGSIKVNSIQFTHIQQITTDRLLGRDTAGTGNVEQLTVSGGIEFTGAGGIQRSALTGDVTSAAGSNALEIAAGAVGNVELRDSAGFSVIGKSTTGTGDPADIAAAADQVLRRSGSGDLQFGTIVTNNIADDAVTDAKLRESAGFSVVGKATTGTGNPADITASTRNILRRDATGNLGFATLSNYMGWYDVHDFGAVGDGIRTGISGTDDAVAIQAAIDAARVIGGQVRFRALVYNHSVKLDIDDCYAVTLEGSGFSTTTDFSGAPQGQGGTMLFYTGGSSATAGIDFFTSSASLSVCKGNGMRNIVIQSAAQAEFGINVTSLHFGIFQNLTILNPEAAGVNMNCLVSGGAGNDAMDNSKCHFENINMRLIDNDGANADGFRLGGSSNANTSNCQFTNIAISHTNGHAIRFINADGNRFYGMTFNQVAGGTGRGILMDSAASAAGSVRANTFYYLAIGPPPGGGNGGFFLDTSGAFPPVDNVCWGYSVENGEALPTRTGGSAEVSDILRYVTTGGTAGGNASDTDSLLGNTPVKFITSSVTVGGTGLTNLFTFPIGASERYAFVADIALICSQTTSTSGGAKFAILGPANATAGAVVFGNSTATGVYITNRLTATGQTTNNNFCLISTTATSGYVRISGYIINGTAPGTAGIQFRNLTTTATSTALSGSSFMARKGLVT